MSTGAGGILHAGAFRQDIEKFEEVNAPEHGDPSWSVLCPRSPRPSAQTIDDAAAAFAGAGFSRRLLLRTRINGGIPWTLRMNSLSLLQKSVKTFTKFST